MKRKLAIGICLAFLASGLIRVGVSVLMMGQAAGWWAYGGEATEALSDTERLLPSERQIWWALRRSPISASSSSWELRSHSARSGSYGESSEVWFS